MLNKANQQEEESPKRRYKNKKPMCSQTWECHKHTNQKGIIQTQRI